MALAALWRRPWIGGNGVKGSARGMLAREAEREKEKGAATLGGAF
jgi:hypothetical protein